MSERPTAASSASREASPEAAAPPAGRLRVRSARPNDADAVARAVGALLLELGGAPTGLQPMRDAARAAIDDDGAAAVLIAEAESELVGVIAASWQAAIHVPGQYGLIQELWVDPAWRSRAIGRELLDAVCELARERGLTRVEVGLPHVSFPGFAATAAFYGCNGFTATGPRMRRLLA